MKMKIDGKAYTQDTEATEASKRTALDNGVKRAATDKTPAASRDRVEVSEDAKLLTAAIDAAKNTPDVRTELVERMKQKLNAGEIGNDSGKLADKMIDDLLGK
jgi:flagellar biosynthesis anti-sigma factor FlgM